MRGRVVDSTGSPVPGASLSLRREADSFLVSGWSGADGRFALEALPGGFELSASAPGFSVARAQVRLVGEAPAEVELSLRPGVFTEEVTVVGTRLVGSAETLERLPGSVDVVDRRQLEDSRVADVNEALRKATGVNVRDEEGLALRPNIGIRGLNPTRSSKTLLLEDGLFVTYAPYGDNATYYHPPVERFEAIEVVKGSGQIAYGPVTVGGVVNYLTPAPPVKPTANLRLTGGNRDYFNGQALAGGTWGGTAVLAEYMRKQGDGARDNLHSVVDDANLKTVFTLGPRHTLTLKGNYYGEDSQVTYSGLTLAEWEADPRQNPFQNDAFDGWRLGASARHTWLVGSRGRPHHPGLRLALQPRLVAPVEQLRPAAERPRRSRLRRHGQPRSPPAGTRGACATSTTSGSSRACARPSACSACAARPRSASAPTSRSRSAGRRTATRRSRARAGSSRTTAARTRPSRPSSRTGCCWATSP